MAIEPHLINLGTNGRLHATSGPHTPAASLPGRLDAFTQAGGRSLTLFFHGGLVSKSDGLNQARALYETFSVNAQSYPLFVLWESGPLETLQSTLLEITQSSPLFSRLLHKLIKHVARKFADSAPAFDEADGFPSLGESVRAQVELEQLPVEGMTALDLLEPLPGAPIDPARDDEAAALVADLAADLEATSALSLIMANSRRRAPAGLEAEREVLPPSATGYLSDDLLRELEGAPPPPDVEAEFFTAATLWAFAGRILRAVIARYRAGTDHGIAGTVLEEMYRAMYADRAGLFFWERIKSEARAAYEEMPVGAPLTDDAPGGTLLIRLLGDLMAQHGPIDLHLVGQSAGAIHICHFIERAVAELGDEFTVRNVVLTAPACRCDLFMQTLAAHAGRIDTLRIFAMEDTLEREDPLLKLLPLAYPHSLLYFVSGLLEATPDAALMGLARHIGSRAPGSEGAAARAWLAARPGSLVLSLSPADAPAGAQADFTSHYGSLGPLGRPLTLNSIAALLRPPPATDLRPLDVEVTPAIARVLELPPPRSSPRVDGDPFGPFGPSVLEAVIGDNEIIDHALVKGLLLVGRSVARLVVQGVEGFFAVPPDQRADGWRQASESGALVLGYGTGWIFGRARRLLMTNNHVIPVVEAAQGAIVEFGYERDLRTGARAQMVLKLDPSAFFLTSPNMAFDGLDYTLVALSRPAPEELGALEPVQGITASATSSIFIVQHPRGNPKSYVLDHNRKVNVTDRYVTYISDTLEGSSGSPLFDDALRLVGIHHVGNHKVTLGSRQEQTNLGSRIEVVMMDVVQQLRASGGWTEMRLREWFGDGPILNIWRATEP